VLRDFARIDLGSEPVPDETTICKFRHLLEEHNLGEEILGAVNLYLQAKGVRITTGTIVDATIIHALLDQKPGPEPGSGNASGEEGEELVLRNEGACGRGQQDEDHSHGGGDSGQCFRCGRVARLVAWG
jgi:IS5 family transposase